MALRTGWASSPAGSLAAYWQYHTGLSYLTAVSDLDLLWRVPTDFALMPLLAGLAGADDGSPRLDGEIVFSDGVAINWRELWQARDSGGQVLAKDDAGPAISLRRRLCSRRLSPHERLPRATLRESEIGVDAAQAAWIAQRAFDALLGELAAWPKPGLVSHVDSGSHTDMDAPLLEAVPPRFIPISPSWDARGRMTRRWMIFGPSGCAPKRRCWWLREA